MSRAWRQEFDAGADELIRLAADLRKHGNAKVLYECAEKIKMHSPQKGDKESVAAYANFLYVYARLAQEKGRQLEAAMDAFLERWDIQFTEGGYERQVLGIWSDKE